MNFSKLWRFLNRKIPPDDIVAFDFLFQLSYMSAVAAAGIPRSKIFELASQMNVSSARYFKDVHLLTQRMNYDYGEACRIVGEATKEPEIKSLLLRLSASLSSGQPEREFLAQEVEVQAEYYVNEYRRKLESLKKWTDGYIALLVSTSLIIVVALTSMVIYRVGTDFVVGLVATMAGISVLGGWIIHSTAPNEIKPLSSAQVSEGQRLCHTLFYTLVPFSLVVSAFLMLVGATAGWIFIAASVFFFPIGLASASYDRRVGKYDEEISVFFRSAGRLATAIGSTVTDALSRIDLRSLGSLAPGVRRLRVRLLSRIKPDLCWQTFVVETGSELVSRSVSIFLDGTSLGGDPQWVGFRSSFFAMKIHLLRAERRLVSSTFSGLCLIMHTAIVGILIFVTEMVSSFGKQVTAITIPKVEGSMTLPSMVLFNFNAEDMQFFYGLLIPTIFIISVVNAFAVQSAVGGHNYKFYYYLAGMLAMSGVVLIFVPKLTEMVFHTISIQAVR